MTGLNSEHIEQAEQAGDRPFISVVMPIRNEERRLEGCIESLLVQDYPKESMEWIFVDGCSDDSTMAILERYRIQHPDLIRVELNPSKTVPYAMNIGIAAARGVYIIRLDAHAEYASEYLSACVKCLEQTGADNVGGTIETKSEGFVGSAIAKMLSSKFGVGNSKFRTAAEDGYVDTVPFGAFRREVFEKWGGYDIRLTRNQDNEMNYRIRSNGGKIFMSNSIKSAYYCRDSLSGIVDMALKNGTWSIVTMKLCPGSMGIRHFIPLAFVVSIVGLLIFGFLTPYAWMLLGFELLAYLALDIVFSIKAGSSIKEALFLLVLFPVFHCSYGVGSLLGLFKVFGKQFRDVPSAARA